MQSWHQQWCSSLKSIDLFPLNAFKPKHGFTGTSIRQWPVLLCDCINQASDGVNTRSVKVCSCLSQGQVLLASLWEMLRHFPFSFRGLVSLRCFSSQVVCLTSAAELCETLQAVCRDEARRTARDKKLLTQWMESLIYLHTTQISHFLFCYSSVAVMANPRRTELNTGHASEEWGQPHRCLTSRSHFLFTYPTPSGASQLQVF